MYKTTSRLLAIAAASLALTVGVATTADAQMPPPPPGGPGMMHGGPHGGPGGPGFMFGAKKLHDKLNLNAAQEKQWQAALDTMKQNGEAMRKSHEQMKQQFDSMKNQPILDLNAMHAAHEQAEQQNHQLREQSEQAWLDFYNGLNDQQKTTVSTALKEHFAKMEQRHDKMRQRWEHHHKGAMPGAASAPAAQ